MVTPPPETLPSLAKSSSPGKSSTVPIAVDDSLPPSSAKKQSPSTIPPSSPSPALKDSSNGSLIEANSLSVPSSSMASSPRAPIVPLKQAAEASQPGESNIIDRRLKEKDCSELDLLTPPAAVGMVSSPPLTIAAEIPTSSLLLGKGAWSIPINIISKEKMQSPSVDLFNQENWPTLKDSQNGDLKKRQGFVGVKGKSFKEATQDNKRMQARMDTQQERLDSLESLLDIMAVENPTMQALWRTSNSRMQHLDRRGTSSTERLGQLLR
ncbi:hypothetical protein Bca52824_023352 [Brassica carinata]|uniref:Uncharacterized protein n=1 Tax=Brassica carinata TaxID=52824 RepID=A0A8X7VI33_BRACI|nr:hypothetical protein Bca52824_023352 [Brassica carinata]